MRFGDDCLHVALDLFRQDIASERERLSAFEQLRKVGEKYTSACVFVERLFSATAYAVDASYQSAAFDRLR